MKKQSGFIPCKKTPCSNCPFRTDSIKGWLGKERITEILNQDSFVCHKTVDYSKDNHEDLKRLQCAGFMILKNQQSMFVRLATVMNLDLGLKGHDLVFQSKEDCIEHHSNRQK
jgi:hypothetical protein